MKTHAPQKYRDLEKLGFLCRWALMALVALVILVATWAGLSGTMAVSSDLETSMLLSDAVWRQGAPRPALYCFLDGPTPRSTAPLFVYKDYFGHLRFPQTDREHNEVISQFPAPGTHRMTLIGLPYGPTAFKQRPATLTIVPEPETVYLMDARFLAGVERDDKQTAIRIAKACSRLGQLVLVFPGRRKSVEDLRTELDQYSDIPQVFSLRKGRGDLRTVIASIARKLRRRGKPPPGGHSKPYVITGDAKLAISTAWQKHYTHLVGSDNAPPELPEFVRLHATPEKLAEHLTKEHTVQPPIP